MTADLPIALGAGHASCSQPLPPDGIQLLVVEDDATLSELLTYNLRRAGYRVLQEFTGPDGLRTAQRRDVALVLLDLMLPGMDGLEVSRAIKEQRPDLPVIMVTAREQRDVVLAGFRSGADDYVVKPFDMEVLLARIGARLARPTRSTGPSVAASPGLVLDTDARVLRSAHGEISLKPKEFELMDLLLSRPGRLFSREEITESVWHHRYLAGSRSLDVHVRRLREKLRLLGVAASIQTVRGAGFRLVMGDDHCGGHAPLPPW